MNFDKWIHTIQKKGVKKKGDWYFQSFSDISNFNSLVGTFSYKSEMISLSHVEDISFRLLKINVSPLAEASCREIEYFFRATWERRIYN